MATEARSNTNPKRGDGDRGDSGKAPQGGTEVFSRHSERLGDLLRGHRKGRGWTLAEVSARTGLAVSILSKVENKKNSLTYNNLAKLAEGLQLDLSDLLAASPTGDVAGQSTITSRGHGEVHETPNYAHEYLCADLARRRMVPLRTLVKAKSLEEFGPFISHPGEEFSFVLEGVVDVFLEGQPPTRLRAGDSIYFDSTVAHAVVSVGSGDAYLVTVITTGNVFRSTT